jgi:hypothetical protein
VLHLVIALILYLIDTDLDFHAICFSALGWQNNGYIAPSSLWDMTMEADLCSGRLIALNCPQYFLLSSALSRCQGPELRWVPPEARTRGLWWGSQDLLCCQALKPIPLPQSATCNANTIKLTCPHSSREEGLVSKLGLDPASLWPPGAFLPIIAPPS